jgi:virginiamycin B lyase
MGAANRIPDEGFSRVEAPAGGDHSGPVKARVLLRDVPTLGSRPHDPHAARDGSIWWSGQFANKLGHVDPKTRAILEYTLKSPDARPSFKPRCF